VHAVSDFVNAIDHGTPIHPDFADGAATNAVLDAVEASANSGAWVNVEQIPPTQG
jgi:predicted dehydrogenase